MKELVPRIFQADFLKGMSVTFRTQYPKYIYTEEYPLEPPMVAERYRSLEGAIWDRHRLEKRSTPTRYTR
jgi:formate hydrogenlyase subunit 6/NADH:ubiquinone oxidoreductase subunit I